MKVIRFPYPMTYDELYAFLIEPENVSRYFSVKAIWGMIQCKADGAEYQSDEMLEFVQALRRDNLPVWTRDDDACHLLHRLTDKLAEIYARQADA